MEITLAKPFLPSKSFLGWAMAVTGAIALNITLFGLMPGLIQRIPASPDKLDALQNVQVIRVKRVENPAHKKVPPKIKKPEPVKQLKQQRLTRAALKKPAFKPRLDFKLNPKLPTTPMDLVMPTIENFSMDGPILKHIYGIAELDTGLTALVKIPPVYPAQAKRRGIEGFVTVEFQVSPKGLAQDIIIIEAKPATLFNRSVKNCIAHWKFRPPTIEGVPVTAKARTTIYFKLE